jgi:hypothetical protein
MYPLQAGGKLVILKVNGNKDKLTHQITDVILFALSLKIYVSKLKFTFIKLDALSGFEPLIVIDTITLSPTDQSCNNAYVE